MPMYKDCKIQAENVEIIYNMPKAVLGEKRVEKLLLNKPYAGSVELAIDGLFLLKEGVSPSAR